MTETEARNLRTAFCFTTCRLSAQLATGRDSPTALPYHQRLLLSFGLCISTTASKRDCTCRSVERLYRFVRVIEVSRAAHAAHAALAQPWLMTRRNCNSTNDLSRRLISKQR